MPKNENYNENIIIADNNKSVDILIWGVIIATLFFY